MKKYSALSLLLGVSFSLSTAFAQVTPVVDTVTDQIDCTILKHALSLGSKDSKTGGDVTNLQVYLSQAGYLEADPTGYFGNATKKAVKAFQSANGIAPQGNVGPYTRAKIKEVSCQGGVVSTNQTNLTPPTVISPVPGVQTIVYYKVNDTKSACTSVYYFTNTDLVNGVYQYKPGQYKTEAECVNVLRNVTPNVSTTRAGVQIVGQPTLKLGYDSTQKEATLTTSYTMSITAPSSVEFKFYKNGVWDNDMYAPMVTLSGTAKNAVGSSVNPTYYKISGNAIDNGTYWSIPAGQTATFSLTATLTNPKNLFAGSYYATVSLYKLAGFGVGAYDGNAPSVSGNSTTNSVLLVGETSPYISSATSDANGLVTVRGERLNLSGNDVFVDGKSIGSVKGDATWFTFYGTNLSTGAHTIQVINNQTGNSNYFQVTLSAQGSDTLVAAITSFSSKVINSITGTVSLVWSTSKGADIAIDMNCSSGTFSITVDNGNSPNCTGKNGLGVWFGHINGSIGVTPVGNTSQITVPFTLTILDKNGSYTNQKQTIYVTFPATVQSVVTPTVSSMIYDSGNIVVTGANFLTGDLSAYTISYKYDCPAVSWSGCSGQINSMNSAQSGRLSFTMPITFQLANYGGIAAVQLFDKTGKSISGVYTMTIPPSSSTGSNTSSIPTVEMVGSPSVNLQYDSVGKESLLVGMATIKITTGSLPITFYRDAVASSVLFSDGTNFAQTNGATSATRSSLNGATSIPANTSVTFYVTNTVKTGQLFAGTYTLKPSSFSYIDANSNYQNVGTGSFKGVTTSNAVTIIGETSPYIQAAATCDSTPQVNCTIAGVRFDATNNTVMVNGVIKVLPSFNNGTFINLKAIDFGIMAPGFYTVTVSTAQGSSNAVGLIVNTTPVQAVSLQNQVVSIGEAIMRQGAALAKTFTGVTSVSASTGCVDITSNLHRGFETSSVSSLQLFLVKKGFLAGDVSGFFGDMTIAAVKAYQRSLGLPETGMVYDFTRQAIKQETCN